MRTGGRRTSKDFDVLCTDLSQRWQTVMEGKVVLNGVFVLRSLEVSIEEGYLLPSVSSCLLIVHSDPFALR